jgi:hypothetical protein
MSALLAGAVACLFALAIIGSFVGHPAGDLGSAAITVSVIATSAFGLFLGYEALESRHRHRH